MKGIIIFLISLGCYAQSFPEHIHFRTKRETFNSKYNFALRYSKVWVSRRESDGSSKNWMELSFHKELKKPIEISADSGHLIVIDSDKRIFSTRKALSEDPLKIKGTKRWGAPLWLGKGYHLPQQYTNWSISFLSPVEDKFWIDPAGNKQGIGQGVSSLYLLDSTKQKIIYLDPWLPNDHSYQICTPQKGRFLAENISVSGSTLFIINKFGDMYVRTYDFDISGADDLFFNYTYDPKKGFGTRRDPGLLSGFFTRRVIPIDGWIKQPKIKGKITDQITIFKKGAGANNRVLRVEGMQGNKTGFFQRETLYSKDWEFIPTGQKISGRFLENTPQDSSFKNLGPSISRSYKGSEDGVQLRLEFSRYCTPSSFEVVFSNKEVLKLKLHHHEGIRTRPSEAGLGEKPMKFGGAIEVSKEHLINPSKRVQNFIKDNFKGKRFTNIKLNISRDSAEIKKAFKFKWKLSSY